MSHRVRRIILSGFLGLIATAVGFGILQHPHVRSAALDAGVRAAVLVADDALVPPRP